MKKLLIISLLLLFFVDANSQSRRRIIHRLQEWGIGAGYNASMIQVGDTIVNDIYNLDVSLSGIVQGVVSDSVALTNRDLLQAKIDLAKSLGAKGMFIDTIDAYFDVQAGYGGSKIENWRRCLQLPSDFDFHGTDSIQTVFRVQPNDKRDYVLFGTWSTDSTSVRNLRVVGDRYTHDYIGGDTGVQDLGYGIYFIGTHNGIIDGVYAEKFTGDGFIIGSPVIRLDDGSPNLGSHYGAINFSKDLIVRNSTFYDNRRNGLALTDVEGALLDNNTYDKNALGGEYSSSVEGYSWKGVIPRHAIDLEAIQSFEADGITLKLTEVISDVIISNSTFTNNYGDIDFYKCWDVDVFGNFFDGGSGNVASYNVSIHDNTFTALGSRARAINIKPIIRNDGSHYSKGWTVYNNTITGYDTAMQIGGENQQIYNNTISDFDTGIQLLETKNNTFDNNDLTSARSGSRGYYSFVLGISPEGLIIKNSDVVVSGTYGFDFNKMIGIGTGVLIDSCSFDKLIRVRESSNITISNCSYPSLSQTDSAVILNGNNP